MNSIGVYCGRDEQMSSSNYFYSLSIITLLWRLWQNALVVTLNFITSKFQESETMFFYFWWSAITTRWRGKGRMFQPPYGKSHIKGKNFIKPEEKEKEHNSFHSNGKGMWVWLPGLPTCYTLLSCWTRAPTEHWEGWQWSSVDKLGLVGLKMIAQSRF